MSRKLNINDSQAIDLLLDQSERSRGSQSSAFSQPSESVFHRVAPAQKLLNLLDAWTVEEPPTDLVQRTLAKVAASHPDRPAQLGDNSSAFGSNA